MVGLADPELLLVVQAIAVASGAIPVYWLARKHFDLSGRLPRSQSRISLYPPVQWLTMSDFHPVALACPLLLFAWWHLDERRLWAFALLAAAAIATKEHVGLAVAAMGVWYAVRYRAPRTGATIVSWPAARLSSRRWWSCPTSRRPEPPHSRAATTRRRSTGAT